MSRTRRTFTREFKLNIVELSYSRGNVAELENELKIRPDLLFRWQSEFASYKGRVFRETVIKKQQRNKKKFGISSSFLNLHFLVMN